MAKVKKGSKKVSLGVREMIRSRLGEDYAVRPKYMAIWDEELGDFINNNKYDFESFCPLLKKHFEEGGSASRRVLAGLCRVSQGTMTRWLTRHSHYYKEELAEFISEYREIGSLITDQWHRESASGERKDANSSTLNRRAEKMLDMVPEAKLVQEFTNVEQVEAEIKRVQEQQKKYLGS